MNEIKHVALYIRASRDEEKLGLEEALRHHRTTLVQMCEANSWNYQIFEEIASSKDIENRAQMVELLKCVEDGQFDAVCCMDIDRLSRNEYDSSDIKRALFNAGTYIVTPTKIYDPSKDEDSLLLGIQSLVAAQEYKQIKKRMQRGKIFAAKMGLWVNGSPPYGYVRNNQTKKLEIHEEEAVHVRYVFEQIAEGKTVSEVFQKLNKMGIKTKKGGAFTFNAIQRMVNNEVYIGTLANNKTIGQYTPRPRHEWIIVPNAHPAIVDEELFYKAKKLENTYKFAKTKKKSRVYPTSRLMYCALCGKLQLTQWQYNVQKFYIKTCSCGNRCHVYVPVLEAIKSEVMKYREGVLALIGDVKINDDNSHYEYELRQLETKLNKATNALDKIEILFEEDEIDLKRYKERKAKRQAEVDELTHEIEKLKATNPADMLNSFEELKDKIDLLSNKWEMIDGEGLSGEEVNRLLHFIIERIEWSYPKGSDEEPSIHIVYEQ